MTEEVTFSCDKCQSTIPYWQKPYHTCPQPLEVCCLCSQSTWNNYEWAANLPAFRKCAFCGKCDDMSAHRCVQAIPAEFQPDPQQVQVFLEAPRIGFDFVRPQPSQPQECRNCKQHGHLDRRWPFDRICVNWKRTGHEAVDCTYPAANSCWICGSESHYANRCTQIRSRGSRGTPDMRGWDQQRRGNNARVIGNAIFSSVQNSVSEMRSVIGRRVREAIATPAEEYSPDYSESEFYEESDEEPVHKLDDRQINSLQAPVTNPDTICSICMDPIGKTRLMIKLPCDHEYHKTCGKKWLKEKATCPACRASVKPFN